MLNILKKSIIHLQFNSGNFFKSILLTITACLFVQVGLTQSVKTKKVGLEKTDYGISLPKDLQLSFKKGVDFLVYFITQKNIDTTKKFDGGIYMGYYPSSFAKDNYKLFDSAYKMVL